VDPEDIASAYRLAWELGCKGITVYVTGSREKVVLETHATAGKKQTPPAADVIDKDETQPPPWSASKKPRPRYLPGFTFSIDTPLGKAFVTVNENGDQKPFEVFVNTAKAGSDTAAVSEAIGRLISYILRLASSIQPTERLREVIRQLAGIGGGRSLGFGPNRVRSLPDGVAQVLDTYLCQKEGSLEDSGGANHNGLHAPLSDQFQLLKIGDLCPECGLQLWLTRKAATSVMPVATASVNF
jgi:ribonucleoside-diphosphate reductase alpha chain